MHRTHSLGTRVIETPYLGGSNGLPLARAPERPELLSHCESSQILDLSISKITSAISSHRESQETSPTSLLPPRLTGNHRKPLQPRFCRLVTQGITGNLFEPRFCRLVSRGITGNLSDLASHT